MIAFFISGAHMPFDWKPDAHCKSGKSIQKRGDIIMNTEPLRLFLDQCTIIAGRHTSDSWYKCMTITNSYFLSSRYVLPPIYSERYSLKGRKESLTSAMAMIPRESGPKPASSFSVRSMSLFCNKPTTRRAAQHEPYSRIQQFLFSNMSPAQPTS